MQTKIERTTTEKKSKSKYFVTFGIMMIFLKIL